LLRTTETVLPELARNALVLLPNVRNEEELASEFYTLTSQEIKREQERRTAIAERELTLRTRAMREKEDRGEQKIYPYADIRIKFPDGLILQGKFKSGEKVRDIYTFVRENLTLEATEFNLKKSCGEILSNMESTLTESHLPPASLVNFFVLNSSGSQTPGCGNTSTYLKTGLVSKLSGP